LYRRLAPRAEDTSEPQAEASALKKVNILDTRNKTESHAAGTVDAHILPRRGRILWPGIEKIR